MEIKDCQPNTGKIDIVAVVVSKDDARTFEKFGKSGQVCNAKIKDETGEITLTLWNEDVDKVNVGDKIHVQNGWCSEFRDQKQLSSGKFGTIEVLNSGEVFTNDPGLLQPGAQGAPEGQEGMMPQENASEDGPVDDVEEFVG